MATVSTLRTPLTAATERALAEPIGDPFARLPEHTRERAYQRHGLVAAMLEVMGTGMAPRPASQLLWSRIISRKAAPSVLDLSRRCKCLSAATLEQWTRQYQKGGLLALAPQNKGRVRKARDWEMRAIALYAKPTRPAFSTVALWLREEGFDDASDHLVRRYLKSLPSHLSETSPKRTGKHFYNQNIRPHVVRDTTTIPVGFIYEGDGHCCDVYVQHPVTGGHFRPELTVWLDIRSTRVVGWWISESESAQSTLFSLSHALVTENHAPAYAHTDPGSGFVARLMSDDVTGWLRRFDIEPIRALPGNAKGKGLVEGWFRWFEERLGKSFDTFCGHCRTDDALSRLATKIKRGELNPPTLAQYIDAIKAYIARYNAAPKDALDGRSPDDLWAELDPVPLETPAAAVLRPREQRTVQRWSVRLHNRQYRAAELQAFEGRDVVVEYSLHNDGQVTIYDDRGAFVCDAQLIQKKAWLPDSRIEEGQQRRLQGQRKRRALKDAEDTARASLPLSAAAVIDALDAPLIPHVEEAAPQAPQHSITAAPVPAAQAPATRALRAVDLDAIREAIEQDQSQSLETAEQRFARAQQLEQTGCNSEADSQWLAIYQTSAEYHSRRDLYEAFNGA